MAVKKEENYWKVQKNALINSFKHVFSKDFFKPALFDGIFIISMLLLFTIAFSLINNLSGQALPQLMNIYEIKQSGNDAALEQALAEYAPVMNKVLVYSSMIAAAGFLLALFFISWLYGKAWLSFKKKYMNRLFLRRYFLANLTLTIFWIVIFILTALIFVTAVAAIIILLELLVIFYSDFVFRSVFNEKNGVFKNLKDAIRISLRFHNFIFFIIFSAILSFMMLVLLGLATFNNVFLLVLTLVFCVVFVGWARAYADFIVAHLKKKVIV